MITVHSKDGRHFLGLRRGKSGQFEIVYDSERHQKRLIWRVLSREVSADDIGRKLHEAIEKATVLDALLCGLRDSEIDFEVDFDWAEKILTGR